jgi:hypothetical protein
MRASRRECRGKGDLAIISQSGAIAAGMIEWAAQRAIGFSAVWERPGIARQPRCGSAPHDLSVKL